MATENVAPGTGAQFGSFWSLWQAQKRYARKDDQTERRGSDAQGGKVSVGIEQANRIEQYATEKWYELDEATRMRVTATQSPADAQTNFLLRNADGKHELIVRSREAMQRRAE